MSALNSIPSRSYKDNSDWTKVLHRMDLTTRNIIKMLARFLLFYLHLNFMGIGLINLLSVRRIYSAPCWINTGGIRKSRTSLALHRPKICIFIHSYKRIKERKSSCYKSIWLRSYSKHSNSFNMIFMSQVTSAVYRNSHLLRNCFCVIVAIYFSSKVMRNLLYNSLPAVSYSCSCCNKQFPSIRNQ